MEPSGTLANGTDLVMVRRLAHPIEVVWRALATSEGLEPWFGTYRGDPASGVVEVSLNAEPGSDSLAPVPYDVAACEPGVSFTVIAGTPSTDPADDRTGGTPGGTDHDDTDVGDTGAEEPRADGPGTLGRDGPGKPAGDGPGDDGADGPGKPAGDGPRGDPTWTLSVELSSNESGTDLEFRHHDVDPEALGEIGVGWEWYLDRLSASLDGTDLPSLEDFETISLPLAARYRTLVGD